ncbi:MAG TPA: MFS transporter, partial [Solirubrobacterales bacterium]|nr:MFS transporter [Solirubrobacterales bacterium]
LLAMALIGIFAFNFNVFLPLMATNEFHGGSSVFGLLLSVMGVGALAGALVAASRQSPTMRLLGIGAAGFGGAMVAAALMPSLPWELVALIPMGALMVTVQATANSLLQLHADPAFRGRVMALYVMVFLGTTPFGGPLVGFIAQHFGPREAFALGGTAAAVAGAYVLWALRRSITAEARVAALERDREPGPGRASTPSPSA